MSAQPARTPDVPPEFTTAARRERFDGYTVKAHKLIEEGNLKEAYRLLAMASSTAHTPDMVRKGKELIARFNKAASEKLIEADREFSDANYASALGTYRELSRFKAFAVGKTADRRFRSAMKNSMIRPAVREAKAAQLFEFVEGALRGEPEDVVATLASSSGLFSRPVPNRTAVEEVEELTDAETYLSRCEDGDCTICTDDCSDEDRAYYLLEEDRLPVVRRLETISNRFGDTATGQRASELLDTLLSDPKFLSDIQDKKRRSRPRRTG
jgi:hypothetical protein